MLWNLFRSRRVRKSAGSPAPRRCLPRVEALETRLAPANVDWINPAGGDWHNAGNWRDRFTGQQYVPGPADDTFVRGSVPPFTVLFNGSGTVKTLAVDHTLQLNGGTLTVLNPTGQDSGISTLDLRSGATLQVLNGSLSTDQLATLAGTLDIAADATLYLGGCGGFSGDRTEINAGAVLIGTGQYVAGNCATVNVNVPFTLPINFRVEGTLTANAATTAGTNFTL